MYFLFVCLFVWEQMQNSSGSSTTEYLSGFKPHSSYEISVNSFTRVGHGNQFSSPVSFTTNESGKIYTVYKQGTHVNTDIGFLSQLKLWNVFLG